MSKTSECQDWTTVVLRKPGKRRGASSSLSRADAPRPSRGALPEAMDDEAQTRNVRDVSVKVARAIARARTAKGWTQKQLAARLGMRPKDIADYESRRIKTPKNAVIARMERVLGVKLPRVPKVRKTVK